MQVNVEYFFRLVYECFHGACPVSAAGLAAWLAHLWLYLIVIGYVLSALALFLIIYATVRLFELREREEKYYNTLLVAPETAEGVRSRWQHIESLASGAQPSEWREAIIEADIMLDEALARHGYQGDNIGERLRSVDATEIRTLQNAWEAHRVRNRIAHEGAAFPISETLARRTVAHYGTVLREFKVI
ncbi:hypothetical protein HY972_01910 [Candidatus Kaiserbacteria bacterium]|nr:hypothetical protein [Candidatus Kaiserbacteria bacterium]